MVHSQEVFFTCIVPSVFYHHCDFQSLPARLISDNVAMAEEAVIHAGSRTLDLSSAASFIRNHELRRVCLQFPNSLLHCSPLVVRQLEVLLQDEDGVRLFVVANSTGSTVLETSADAGSHSYNGCCIDEVSPAQVKADGIIHFGPACFSRPPVSIPVHYVLPRAPLDVTACASSLYQAYTSVADNLSPKSAQLQTSNDSSSSSGNGDAGLVVVIILAQDYGHAAGELRNALAQLQSARSPGDSAAAGSAAAEDAAGSERRSDGEGRLRFVVAQQQSLDAVPESFKASRAQRRRSDEPRGAEARAHAPASEDGGAVAAATGDGVLREREEGGEGVKGAGMQTKHTLALP